MCITTFMIFFLKIKHKINALKEKGIDALLFLLEIEKMI